MPSTQIQMMTGRETIEWGLAKVAMFTHAQGVESFVSEGAGVKRVGPMHFTDAVPGLDKDLAGRWVTSSYEIQDGTILKLYAKVKDTKYGAVAKSATMILRVRKDAPLHKITIPLSGHRFTAVKEAVITGRFDVLTLKEAKSRYKFKPPEKSEENYLKSSCDSVFIMEEMAEGTVVREKVREVEIKSSDNTVVKVVTVRKLRKLGL